MSASDEFIEFVMELLEPIRAIEGKKFFGGYGIKSDNIQFAMIMGNSLYFVVDDLTRPKYQSLGKQPFCYSTKRGQVFVNRYFEVPEDLFEDPQSLLAWARESIEIAARSPKKR